jgi:nucleoid DNA-binding protein
MTLTKAELADLLFESVGLNKREAKDMVEAFFEEIRNSLETSDGVKLSGFGNFSCVTNHSALDVTRKPVRKSLLLPAAWLLSMPARN